MQWSVFTSKTSGVWWKCEENLRFWVKSGCRRVKRSLAASFTKNKSRPFGGLNFWWRWRELNPRPVMTSWRHTTRLFHFYCFSSSRWANGQAPFRLFFLKSRRWTGNQNSCARVLLTPRSLSTRQGQDVAVKRRVRTLRSQLLFWLMFYEANSHPRRAFGNQHIQSNPEHPQYSMKCVES